MATEYILAATMLFDSYASPVERPIEGVFADPVQCMSHWQAASRRTGMTFLNIEGTLCVERQRVPRAASPPAAEKPRKLSAAERARSIASYEQLIRASEVQMRGYEALGDHGRIADVSKDIERYKGLIAALR